MNHVESTLRNRGNLSGTNGQIDQVEGLSDRASLGRSEIERDLSSRFDSNRKSDSSKEIGDSDDLVNGVQCHSFAEERLGLPKKWKRVLWKACVYLITLGMLISLLAGLNMSWTAITAALAFVVLDSKDARPSLEKVISV